MWVFLGQQARLLAYLDAFLVICVTAAVFLPVALLVRNHRLGFKDAGGGH